MTSFASNDRYHEMFVRLRARNEAALIPFFVLGFPDEERCLQLIDCAIEAGADALELGIAFSDPVADGPTIVQAVNVALAAGATPGKALALITTIRHRHPDIPIGLLLYSNLVLAHGLDEFCAAASAAGVDSLLLADMPLREAQALRAVAPAHNLATVFILPPAADDAHCRAVAEAARGYVYLLSRAGVTGAAHGAAMPLPGLVTRMRELQSPPLVLGFGIAAPEQVRAAVASGVDGVIVGSALIEVINSRISAAGAGPTTWTGVSDYLRAMKMATRTATTIATGT